MLIFYGKRRFNVNILSAYKTNKKVTFFPDWTFFHNISCTHLLFFPQYLSFYACRFPAWFQPASPPCTTDSLLSVLGPLLILSAWFPSWRSSACCTLISIQILSACLWSLLLTTHLKINHLWLRLVFYIWRRRRTWQGDAGCKTQNSNQ